MPNNQQHAVRRPMGQVIDPERSGQDAETAESVATADDLDTIDTAPDASEPTIEEMRAAYDALKRGESAAPSAHPKKAAAGAVTTPDELAGIEDEDLVTVLLPTVYRKVIAGEERRNHRVFVSGTLPSDRVNEETGRALPGAAITVTFTGGVARDVRYAVAKGWKKTAQFRAGDAMKVVAHDTPETAYARLCGVQPMQPGKQAAMLLASDLDAVLGEFTTEQLGVFAAALQRRVAEAQRASILNSGSFQRG